MATPLNQNQIRVLEQTRQRLVQLTHSIGSLVASLQHSDPLPPWYYYRLFPPLFLKRKRILKYDYRSSLQSQASIISNNLASISAHLSENHDLLSSLVAYPGPTYPGLTQSGVLEQLLRTKLEPRAEDWVERGRAAGEAVLENRDGLSAAQLDELWQWAPVEANREARRRNWGGNYTLEEREMGIENVVTGLQRQLEDDEQEEEGEEEGDKMEIAAEGTQGQQAVGADRTQVAGAAAGPAMALNEVFRYMISGSRPQSGPS